MVRGNVVTNREKPPKPHFWLVMDYHPVFERAFNRFLVSFNGDPEIRAMLLSSFGWRRDTNRPLVGVAWRNRLRNLNGLVCT